MKNKDDDSRDSILGFAEMELRPSALMIYAKSFEDVPLLKSRIERISKNFEVESKGMDVARIRNNLVTIRNTMRILSLILVAVVMVMFSFIYYFRNKDRKKEIGILMALGLTGGEVLCLIAYEMIRISLWVFMLSLAFVFLVFFLSKLLMLDVLFMLSPISILWCFMLSVFIVSVSGVSSLWRTSRINIVDAIRNNK